MNDFWVRKMRTYFTRIDFDRDGALTRKDFEGMAERFIQTGNFDKAKANDMRCTLLKVWDSYLSKMGTGSTIQEDAFIKAMRQVTSDITKTSTIEGPLPLFFQCVDSNGDNLIQEDEFVRFFQIIGIDDSFAPAAFRAIDTNHDGDISLEEFIVAGTSFFFGEDDSSPSQMFWGPLV